MCPHVVVKAGGGAGGGGGGKGAGSGGGGSGGGPGGDGDGAGDGDPGSGACGGGAAGGCGNCNKNASAGDPVHMASGTVFTEGKTDVWLPGTFNLDFRRNYNTKQCDDDVGFGHGWSHSLNWRLEAHEGHFAVIAPDGSSTLFPRVPEGGQVIRGKWALLRMKNLIAVRPGSHFIHVFDCTDPDFEQYRLMFVTYRNRGAVKLHYASDGHLERIEDTVGRNIVVTRTPNRRHIAQLSVTSDDNQTIVFARYDYDSQDNLIAATDADGHTTQYAYDGRHLLTTLRYPNGLVFRYRYDREDRCVETWGEPVDPRFIDPDAAAELADGTPARGIFHTKLEFYPDDFTEVITADGIEQVSGGPDGITQMVDALGGVTTREYDGLGRVTSWTDATNATWSYEYDDLDEVIAEEDPDGGRWEYERFYGFLEKIVDPLGATLVLEHDNLRDIKAMVGPLGGRSVITRDDRGLVTQIDDERGGTRRYWYDHHANVIASQTATGEVEQFEYDYWGRQVLRRDGLGHEWRYQYTRSGLVSSSVSPTGQTHRYRHDFLGNPTEVVEPTGHATTCSYAGLGWLHDVQQRDGSRVRLLYDRSGSVMRLTNERGETYHFKSDALRKVVEERDFRGVVTKRTHDAAGRLIKVEDARGEHNFVRSAGGRLLEHQTPNGDTATYEYDARGDLTACQTSSVDFGSVSFTWERDDEGNISLESWKIGELDYWIKSVRDASGDRISYETSLGLEVRVGRDARGRVAELDVAGDGIVERHHYDQRGALSRRELAQGGVIEETRDGERNLTRRRVLPAGDPGSEGHVAFDNAAPAADRFDIVYDYSPVGDLTRLTEADGETTQYSYDARSRLTSHTRAGQTQEYESDAAGNLRLAGQLAERDYGRGNTLDRDRDLQFTYDDFGALVEKRRVVDDGDDEVTRYSYDGFGMLARVDLPNGEIVQYQYDAFARLVARHHRDDEASPPTTVHHVWDLQSIVHERELGAASGRNYLFASNSQVTPLAHQGSDGTWYHHVNDLNGTPCAIVDALGRVRARQGTGVFGRVERALPADVDMPVRGAGQLEDATTGLYYNRYRHYDPDRGRFISPDPIRTAGGMHFYQAVPNPLTWVDPMGWHGVKVTKLKGSKGTVPFEGEDLHSGGYQKDKTDGSHSESEGAFCPPPLQQQPAAHTEQKYAWQLIKDKDKTKGSKAKLSGELPPCPRCHAAMMRAAKETKSKIEYEYGDPPRKITYDGTKKGKGNNPKVSYSGMDSDKDKELEKAYDKIKLREDWEKGDNFNDYDKDTKSTSDSRPSANDLWGYDTDSGGKGTDKAYQDSANEIDPGRADRANREVVCPTCSTTFNAPYATYCKPACYPSNQ